MPEPLKSYIADQTTLRGYLVRVSNDGRLWTNSVTFVLYDGTCLQCLPEDSGCSIKVGKYRILVCLDFDPFVTCGNLLSGAAIVF